LGRKIAQLVGMGTTNWKLITLAVVGLSYLLSPLVSADLVTSDKIATQSVGVSPSSTPDLASLIEIQIEEVCMGKPGLFPTSLTTSPQIHMAPYFGQRFGKNSDYSSGTPLMDPISLDEHKRVPNRESHAGHYVFEDLRVSVRHMDIFANLTNQSYFLPRKDEDTGESSIEFYGVNLDVKSGLTQIVRSRWAFNGDESSRWGKSTSPLLEADPVTGEFYRIDALWPSTAVLINSTRRFVTKNESFFGAYNHGPNNEKLTCDRTPYIVYSVKRTPSI
jgi:hypothetical protein